MFLGKGNRRNIKESFCVWYLLLTLPGHIDVLLLMLMDVGPDTSAFYRNKEVTDISKYNQMKNDIISSCKTMLLKKPSKPFLCLQRVNYEKNFVYQPCHPFLKPISLNLLFYVQMCKCFIHLIYSDSVRAVICESWHFTRMQKARAWPHHFSKRGCLVP